VGNSGEAQLFFSRRIGIGEDGDLIPIDGGVRVSGKIGKNTNVGMLYMSSEAVENIAPANKFTLARVNQEIGKRSSVGAIFVERSGDGSYLTEKADDYNRAYGVDGRLGIGENTMITAWAAKTDTPGLEGDDKAWSVKAAYDSAKWSDRLEYTQVGEDFNPELGFLTRDGYRKASMMVLRRVRPENLWGLMEVRPHASYRAYWDFEGFQETGLLHMDVHWEWKNGYEFHTGYNLTRDGIKESFEIVDDVWVPAGTYDHGEAQLFFTTDRAAPFSFRLRTTIGGKFGGDRYLIAPAVNYRIGDKFSSSLSVHYNDFNIPTPGGKFSVLLSRLRLSYAFTPKILLQALMQYNDKDDLLSTNLRFSWLRH